MDVAFHRKAASKPAVFEFRTGLTPYLLHLGVAVFVVASFLAFQGVAVNRTYLGTHRGDMFHALSAILVVGFLGTLWRFMLGRAIELNPRAFVLKEGNYELQIPWQQVTFHPTTGRWPMFERCMISDLDGTTVELHRMFYPQYDQIVKQVEAINRRLTDI